MQARRRDSLCSPQSWGIIRGEQVAITTGLVALPNALRGGAGLFTGVFTVPLW